MHEYDDAQKRAGGRDMTAAHDHAAPPDAARQLEVSIASVRDALSGLRFGNVSLTVHEGRVVQIDVTEKKRFQAS